MFQKKGVGTRRLSISRGFAARDGSAFKTHSTILQRLRRQNSLDYYTIPPATQATERTNAVLSGMNRFNKQIITL